MSITLYGFSPAWGLPDPSPFVCKAEILLKMAKLPYTLDTSAALRKAPKGKIPFIADEGVLIPDSSLIRLYLEKKYKVNFDAHVVDDPTRAAAYLAEKYCEDNLYFYILHYRWSDDDRFNHGPRRFFGVVPRPIRPFIIRKVRGDVRKMLHGQGTSRHSDAELMELMQLGLKALSGLLGDRTYFGGAEPCGADASIASMLWGLRCGHFKGSYATALDNHPNLVSYCARMLMRFYPEYATT